MAKWSLLPIRIFLTIAVSILKEYNANHPGKLDEYIRLHVCHPGSDFAWIFKDEWAGLTALHPNSLPVECPDMIFKMMSALVQPPQSLSPRSRGYHSVDSLASHLHAPVSQEDTDDEAVHGVHCPTASESLSARQTSRFPAYPVDENDCDWSVPYAILTLTI